MKNTPTLRITLALLFLGALTLAGQYGCVASRKELTSIENRTSEIQENLIRLQRAMEDRFEAVERLDGKYDYNNNLFMDGRTLDGVLAAIIMIQTHTVFETQHTAERFVKVSRGTGIVSGRYVLTLDHVVAQDKVKANTLFGPVDVPAKRMGERTYLVTPEENMALKQVMRDPALDIALFEIPKSEAFGASLPCPLGNSDDLSVGNYLYVVGNPFNSGINMREGIVSSLFGLEGIEKISVPRDDLFVISNGVVPGDSGAPVLGLRDGAPELVGLVQGTLGSTRIGWAVKINPILESLSQHIDAGSFCEIERKNPDISAQPVPTD